MNPKVDAYLKRAGKWKAEMTALRDLIASNRDLTEDFKWGHPSWSVDGQNVLLIHGFKEYCAVLFNRGALLKDPKGMLVQQTKNVQSARQVRFTSVAEVKKLATPLKAYVREAIALTREGKRVKKKTTEEYEVPPEFASELRNDEDLRAAFEALTPGRQRGYLFYFAQAKQSKTRAARVEKHVPRILEGLGIDD